MVRNCPSYLSQACKGRDMLAEVIIRWYPTSLRACVGLCVSTTVRYVFQACIHMGNEDMGGGLYCVVCAVSTNDVLSCSTAKSTYSPLSICCCSWVGTGTGSCWEVFWSGCSCCGCCRHCICRYNCC